jgi:beta-phosphoglucomutase-like phosphatase (HAD superfamily)
MLGLAGLDGAVSTIVSADDVLDAPPAHTAYERALEQLSRRRPLHRDRVVAISPTSVALRAARAAGVRTVAIGAPAHVAIEANGAVDAIDGLSLPDLARLAGIATAEHQR